MVQSTDGSVITSDINKLRHIIRFLKNEFPEEKLPEWGFRTADISQQINCLVRSEGPDFRRRLHEYIAPELLHLDDFHFFKESDEACYFALLMLGRLTRVGLEELDRRAAIRLKQEGWRGINLLAPSRSRTWNVTGPECRFLQLVLLVDSGPFHREEGLRLLNALKNRWSAEARLYSFKWLKIGAAEQLLWAEQYLEREESFFRGVPLPSSVDRRLSIVASFLAWPEHPAVKKLLYQKMSKAWSQQKLRVKNKQDNKRALNVFVHKETKDLLADLARAWRMTQADVIEQLVREKFEPQSD